MSRPALHPADATLERVAAGDLDAGPALVVATHLALCPHCRVRLQALESVGGAVLEDQPAVALSPAAAALRDGPPADRPAVARTPAKPRRAPPMPPGTPWPAPLAAFDFGPWRFLAPGVRWSRADMPAANPMLLLRVRPGAALPQHGHSGTEYTCVLAGSFDDRGQRIAAGDVVECDDTVQHRPAVDSADDCICVLSVDGRLVMPTWLARLAQRVAGL